MLFAAVFVAGCAPTMMQMQSVRADGQDETYRNGTPVLKSRSANTEVAIAPNAGPTGRYEHSERFGFMVAIRNLSDHRIEISEQSVSITGNGKEARVITAREVENEVRSSAAWARAANAFSAALDGMAASQAGTTTYSGNVGGKSVSAVSYNQGAAMQAQRQVAADHAAAGSRINANEREALRGVVDLLQRNTLEPGEQFIGAVVVARSPERMCGSTASGGQSLVVNCKVDVRLTVDGETHAFRFKETIDQ